MLKVAIVIPCYNSEKTITETLDSIEKQVDNPFILDIIIADDCSTDATLMLCKNHPQLGTRLNIFPSAHNQGERKNINRLMPFFQEKNFDWFFILHSDDCAKPTWIEETIRSIGESDTKTASICSSWDNWYPEQGRVIEGENLIDVANILIEGTLESVNNTLQKGCWWHISGCAIHVKAFQLSGGFNPDMPQLGDFDWLLRILNSGWSIHYIPRSLILYRQHAQSISSNSFRNDRDIYEFIKIFPTYLARLDYTIFSFLWRQKLITMARRLVRSFLLLDPELILKRLKTLSVLNFYFIKWTLNKLTKG